MAKANILYKNVEQSIIPAAKGDRYYRNKDWARTTIAITEDHLIYKNSEAQDTIPLKDIYYLDRKIGYPKAQGGTVLNFNYKKDEETYMGLIKTENKNHLKKTILIATISNIPIYFISPYQSGGRIHTDKEWQKGVFQVTKSSVILKSPDGEVINEIPERKIFGESEDKIKGYDALKLNYEKDDEELADLMFSPEVSLAILGDFFSEVLMKKKGRKRKLSPEEKEVMMAIQTGINSSSEIAELMGMDHEEVLDMIDKLKEKQVINIVGREKIVELSSEGKQSLEGSGDAM